MTKDYEQRLIELMNELEKMADKQNESSIQSGNWDAMYSKIKFLAGYIASLKHE